MQSRKIAKGNSRVFGAGIHVDILWGQGSVREGLGACDPGEAQPACLGVPSITEDQAYGKTRSQMLMETARCCFFFPKLLP